MRFNLSKLQSVGVYFVAIVGTFFIMAWMIAFVRKYTEPPPLNQARVQERLKALAELEAANAEVLNNYAWVDQARGLVRLPIKRAMELTIQEWKNPAQARASLIDSAEKASPPSPPAAEKPAQAPAQKPPP